mgnify:CR=1|jgi:hypothetical protein
MTPLKGLYAGLIVSFILFLSLALSPALSNNPISYTQTSNFSFKSKL